MLELKLVAEQRSGHAIRSALAVLMRGDLPRMLARWQSVVLELNWGLSQWVIQGDGLPITAFDVPL
jgi:hypothetical protein